MTAPSLTVGMLLFPQITQLDLTGPYEVFARMPNTRVVLIAATHAPVRSEHGLTITPDCDYASAPALDIICVPGGGGVNALLNDGSTIAFLQHQAATARYITSVCTGALLLGAAGLLKGYRATTHWMSLDLLPLFGAEVVSERVVVDRNRITGGGVTAGIDFGLVIAAELFGPELAQSIQLTIEYNPAPPFNSGSPQTAPAELLEQMLSARQAGQARRRELAEQAAARL